MRHIKSKSVIFFLSAFLIAASSFFTACDNFMNAGAIRKEIEEAIAYNNAQGCTIIFKAEIETGEFIGSLERTVKEGYETEVQFELNTDDYVFDKLEAVSQEDKKSSRADCVEIVEIERNDKKGRYKYTIKLLHHSDILIRPVCKKIPKLDSIAPESKKTFYSQDEEIKFSFNKPVDINSFGDFSCISIYTDDNVSLNQYFNFSTPVFSSDHKTLTIQTLPGNPILSPSDARSTLTVQVDYDFTTILDSEDGMSFKDKGTHAYKINKTSADLKPITISLQADPLYGHFLSSNVTNNYVDYSFDVQFQLNSTDYKFIRFEAVSSNNTSVILDCSEIGAVVFDEENGIYKAPVKITEQRNDIIIRPVCYMLPAVESYTPTDSNQLNYTNTSIVITFSMIMNMNPETIDEYLTILCDADVMNSYFEKSVTETGNKTILTLLPKAELLKNYITSKNPISILLDVSLPSDISAIKEGVVLPLKQDAKASFSVKYKPEIDSTPPGIQDFFATRHEITSKTAKNLSQNYKFELQTINDRWGWTPELITKNMTNDTIYLYGQFVHEKNTIKEVCVKETYMKNESSERSVETVYNAQNSNVEFFTDERGNTFFCVKHKFKGARAYDDTIHIDCYVTDNLGVNSESVSFSTYRKYPYLDDILYYNLYLSKDDIYDESVFDIAYYEENVKRFKISYDPHYDEDGAFIDYAAYMYYEDDEYDEESDDDIRQPNTEYKNYYDAYTFECDYIDKDGILKKNQPLTNDKDEMCFYIDLDVNSVNGLKVLLRVKDDVGNVVEKELVFPIPCVITNFSKNGNTATMTCAPSFQMENENLVLCSFMIWDLEEDKTPKKLIDETGGDTTELEIKFVSGKTYKMIPCYKQLVEYNCYLCGDISELSYTINSTINNAPDVEVVGEPICRKGRVVPNATTSGDKFYMDVIVNIAEDSWEHFDNIYLTYNQSRYYYPEIYFPKGETSVSFEREIGVMYNEDTIITVYGIIGTSRSTGIDCSISKFTGADYDYKSPNIEVERINPDCFEVTMTDYESGMDYGYIENILDENGNYKYTFPNTKPSANETTWSRRIKVWEIPSSDRIEAVGFDKKGNKGQGFGDYIQTVTREVPWYYRIGNKTSSSITIDSRDAYLTVFKMVGNEWQHVSDLAYGTKSVDYTTYPYYYYYRTTFNSSSCQNIFIRVLDTYYSPFSPCGYIWTGSQSNTGDYDLLLPNGSSKTSVGVSSDAPVFVQTYSTKLPYSECKDWAAAIWDSNNIKILGGKILTFSSSDHSSKRYSIPMDQIENGECYVVIAHFADGSTAMSEVMQKP